MAATHHHSAGWRNTSQPSVAAAAASWPADSVTCRTSSSSPKKPVIGGINPSMKPSAILDVKPEMLPRMKSAQRRARASPSARVMRGL